MSDHIEIGGKKYYEDSYLVLANENCKRRDAQIAALTAQLQQAKDLCEKSYVHQSALTIERDRLAAELETARAAEAAYHRRLDAVIPERDQLRAALEALERKA